MEVYNDIILERVSKKRKTFKQTKIICIAGDELKNLIAYFLGEIVAKSYEVILTKGSPYLLEGISEVINKEITDNKTAVIIPIEGNNREDLSIIVQTLGPDIGIYTDVVGFPLKGIEEKAYVQKISEFFLQNTYSIQFLSLTGKYAEKCIDLIIKKNVDKNIHTLRLKSSEPNLAIEDTSNMYLYVNEMNKQGASFTLRYKQKIYTLKTSMKGEQTIWALSTAVYIADYLGIPSIDIEEKVSEIKVPEGYMSHHAFLKSQIIDASAFSSTYILAILRYLHFFTGKKLIILSDEGLNNKIVREVLFELKNSAPGEYTFLANDEIYKKLIRHFSPLSPIRLILYSRNEQVIRLLKHYLKGKEDIAAFLGNASKSLIENILRELES